MGRRVAFVVRGTAPSRLYPIGTKAETVEAEYSDEELAFMRRLREQIEAAEPGSPERAAALNTAHTIHEMKALLDAEMVDGGSD